MAARQSCEKCRFIKAYNILRDVKTYKMTKGDLNMRAQEVARYNPPRDKDASSEKGKSIILAQGHLPCIITSQKHYRLVLTRLKISRVRKYLCYNHENK